MENIQGGRAKEKEDASDLFLLKKACETIFIYNWGRR